MHRCWCLLLTMASLSAGSHQHCSPPGVCTASDCQITAWADSVSYQCLLGNLRNISIVCLNSRNWTSFPSPWSQVSSLGASESRLPSVWKPSHAMAAATTEDPTEKRHCQWKAACRAEGVGLPTVWAKPALQQCPHGKHWPHGSGLDRRTKSSGTSGYPACRVTYRRTITTVCI